MSGAGPRPAPAARVTPLLPHVPLEAATIAQAKPARPALVDAVGGFLSRYGLILVLLILPVAYGIQDVTRDGTIAPLLNNLVQGLSNGAIWALVALGYTLVYGIIELINFAHGEVFMIGSFVSFAVWSTLGLSPESAVLGLALGLLAALVVAALASG